MSRMAKQVGNLDEGEQNLTKSAMQRSGQLRGVSHRSRNECDVSLNARITQGCLP